MNKTLELVFLTEQGKTVRITANDPREDLQPAEVLSAMEQIIQSNAFITDSGLLVSAKEARIVERSVEVIEL